MDATESQVEELARLRAAAMQRLDVLTGAGIVPQARLQEPADPAARSRAWRMYAAQLEFEAAEAGLPEPEAPRRQATVRPPAELFEQLERAERALSEATGQADRYRLQLAERDRELTAMRGAMHSLTETVNRLTGANERPVSITSEGRPRTVDVIVGLLEQAASPLRRSDLVTELERRGHRLSPNAVSMQLKRLKDEGRVVHNDADGTWMVSFEDGKVMPFPQSG